MAADTLDLQVETPSGQMITLSVPPQAVVEDVAPAHAYLAEDQREPYETGEGEEVITLTMSDGSAVAIALPQQQTHFWDEEEAQEEHTITLETPSGIRVNIALPQGREREAADLFAYDSEQPGQANSTYSLTFSDGTSVAFAAPVNNANPTPTKPIGKPGRVGVGEDTTDIPDLNDPEGLIVVLPGGTTIQTPTR